MQQRVWYLEQLHPGRTVYNVPSAHRLQGALDRDALQAAFAQLVERQSVLRTVIGQHEGAPYQHVLEKVDATLTCDDLRGLEGDAQEGELARRMQDEIARPFDLVRGPLFRARLFALSDDEHVLFFMAHHLVWGRMVLRPVLRRDGGAVRSGTRRARRRGTAAAGHVCGFLPRGTTTGWPGRNWRGSSPSGKHGSKTRRWSSNCRPTCRVRPCRAATATPSG